MFGGSRIIDYSKKQPTWLPTRNPFSLYPPFYALLYDLLTSPRPTTTWSTKDMPNKQMIGRGFGPMTCCSTVQYFDHYTLEARCWHLSLICLNIFDDNLLCKKAKIERRKSVLNYSCHSIVCVACISQTTHFCKMVYCLETGNFSKKIEHLKTQSIEDSVINFLSVMIF